MSPLFLNDLMEMTGDIVSYIFETINTLSAAILCHTKRTFQSLCGDSYPPYYFCTHNKRKLLFSQSATTKSPTRLVQRSSNY